MKCNICGKNFNKKDMLIDHVSKTHKDNIPNNMTVEQYVYYMIHGTIKGKCMCGCGKDTEWNFKTGKPFKVSTDPECRKRIREIAVKNGSDGHLLKDIDHQKRMQKGRSIAGVYTFRDGKKIDYLANNELAFLKFCENVCEFTSPMILNATQVFTYKDNGVERKYMPDFYLPDYNLLVEIKGNNTNPEYIKDTGYKVALKDGVMSKQTEYNFIKITDNKFGGFMEMLFDISNDIKSLEDGKINNRVMLESALSLDEQHEGLFMVVVRNRIGGDITNVSVFINDHKPFTFYFSNGKGIVLSNDIHDICPDDTCFPDFYKYIGEKSISNRFINLLNDASICESDSYSHPVMGILNLMADLGISTPLDSTTRCDFVQYIL